ncbi:uncharacterized protein M421DRAFT_2031 [Didymella exigua CBS 183.55]|uniref:DUF7730 domain-containing protein n=1 Tax=Didymella exigua CBS 183.55 TaxID=1150837 RepID=A0A6A5RYG8_9PLEO|nr:uncharacterized protein M421DRAFT_2031 [Didymella exigua CBS 183.55]KAF1932400.1 hypothetical protein M421DRAFT_2031 [Didymella exigua CBS 183.55]
MDKYPGTRTAPSKRRTGPVRRLENGMLDVTRKSGKHVRTIRTNSQSRLLRLPPELRNQIWEYALGGHAFDITTRKVFKQRKRIDKAKAWDLPINTFALLRVCRQIYAETALIPYKHNAFCFASEDAFDWAVSLRPVQQNIIAEIHVATIGANRMLAADQVSQRRSLLPDALHFDRFPGLKLISFDVLETFQYDEKRPAAQQTLALLAELLIAAQELRIALHLRKVKPDVRMAFVRVKVVPKTPPSTT